MNPTITIISVLDGMRPPRALDLKTPFELMSEKLFRRSLWTVLGVFVLLGMLALWHQFNPLPDRLKSFAQILAGVATVLPFAAWILMTIAAFFSLFSLGRVVYRNFLEQIDSDARYAATLNEFPEIELKRAKAALELKITRTRNRIGMFAGSPEKLALLALAGMGWVAYTSLAGKIPVFLVNGFTGANLVDALLVVGAGSLLGMTLGTAGLHMYMQRYVYQLELVNLALASR
jgi:hypothetical protein